MHYSGGTLECICIYCLLVDCGCLFEAESLTIYSLRLPHLVLILTHPCNQTCFPWNSVRVGPLLELYTSISRQPQFSNCSDRQWDY